MKRILWIHKRKSSWKLNGNLNIRNQKNYYQNKKLKKKQ